MEQSVPTSSNTFWRTPFLEKEPPKITEGGPFDPHWPVSRINPGVSLSSAQASLCCREAEDSQLSQHFALSKNQKLMLV